MDLREIPSSSFERHPWEVARAGFFLGEVRDRVAAQPVKVLDVGGGDGYVGRRLLAALPSGSEVTCFDPNYTAEQLERFRRDAPTALRFTSVAEESDAADWLLMLDVLEHVPDDVALLSRFAGERLRPGGYALLSVPAWPMLFTQHDVVLGHHRRYIPGQLEALAAGAGLEAVASGSLFSGLLLPRALAKMVEQLRGVESTPLSASASEHASTEVGAWRGGPKLTAAVAWALEQDIRANRALTRAGVKVPGLSVWCLSRKPLTA